MKKSLRPDMSVRLLAHSYPAAKDVLRRHGEQDDRPVFGHLESLEHFARRKRVAIDNLLAELASATGASIDRQAKENETLHRPFVLIALIMALTLGGAWGAYLLVEIGVHESFAVAPPADVVAHGMAQLWGFTAIFIAGIALRLLPAATSRQSASRTQRRLILALLVAGAVSEFAWAIGRGALAVLGPVSGVALLAGAITYCIVVARAVREKWSDVWARSALMACVWMVVWGSWTLWIQTRAASPGGFHDHDRQIVMDLSLFGFALGSVYGFGANLLPGFLATGSVRRKFFGISFWLHNSAVVVLVAGRLSGFAPAVMVGLCGIALAAASYVTALRGLRGQSVSTSREKGHPVLRRYLQLALVWLVVTTVSMAIITLIESARGVALPHAIHGAARHALTVGFLVTLILGMGQRLLPVLGHTLLAWPRLVTPILVLIGAGNLIRVATEAASPWWSPAFRLMPVSALLELAALSLFTANVIRTLWPAPDPLIRTGRVSADSRLAILLSEHPWIEDRMIEWGIDYVKRTRQVPAELTLGTFAASHDLDTRELIQRINTTLAGEAHRPEN